MKQYRKAIIFIFSFILITIAVVVGISLTSEYRYNEVTILGAGVLEETVSEDLSLDDDFYLLSPSFILDMKLKGLSYIESYSYVREVPNKVTITVQPKEPTFCSYNTLLYMEKTVVESDIQDICVNVPLLANPLDSNNALFEEYATLNEELKLIVDSIKYIDETAVEVVIDELTINVYITDLSKIEKYNSYKAVDGLLELRTNYS